MPAPETILAGLRLASVRALAVAGLWHAVLAVGLIAVVRGWRPSRRLGAVLFCLPIVSASTLAFIFGNPFNGALLGLTGPALLAIASRLNQTRVRLASTVEQVIGGAMIGFAWVYPHFLQPLPAATYLWAAPMGVVPCPTLSLVVGLGLVFGGIASRAWSLVVALVALFYGLFGVFRLGVAIDVVLVAGAAALLIFANARSPRRFCS